MERLGFVRRRQKGSHLVMRRGSAVCVVPMHGKWIKAHCAVCCGRRESASRNLSKRCDAHGRERGNLAFRAGTGGVHSAEN
jgi:hypothetical protein